MKNLMTGRGVREVSAVQTILQPGSKSVGHEVDRPHAGRIPAGFEAGTVDDPSFSANDGGEQIRLVRRRVFQVRVLDEDHISSGMGEGRSHGPTFPSIDRVADEPDARKSACYIRGPIG